MSIEQKIEQFIKRLVEHHGFGVNDNLACLISDQKSIENEGFFIWVFSQKRNRFETKIEKFHTKARLQKVKEGLSLSEKEYEDIVLPAIVNYLDELKKIGFSNIGKGINLFGKGKLHNLQGEIALFENDANALKKLEQLTINNPITVLLEQQGFFTVKNKSSLVWDEVFGTSTSKKSTKSKAKSATKIKPLKEKATVKKVDSKQKKLTSQSEKSEAVVSKKSADLSKQFKQLATQKEDPRLAFWQRRQKTWDKQTNELYKKIQTWIAEYIKSGYIKISTSPVQLFDSLNRNYYEIDALHLDIVGGHKIILNPVEMNILGAIARMDVQHYGNNTKDKITMLLVDKGKSRFIWEFWRSLKDKQSVNEKTFENLLSQWIGK